MTQSPDDAARSAAASVTAVAIAGYEILAELGRGGMGVVFKARQLKLNRIVALKMILRSAHGSDVVRFLIEAEAVAAVKHTNVVQVFEYGESDGRPFLAMEFLEGGSLAGKLGVIGQFEPRVAAALVGKIARGVQAAHDVGVVHRDLKPGNVLLDVAGEPKVTDFGLAKRLGGADLTNTHAVMGTPAYMSPEQAKGETKFVGPGADVYALGVILYECLTGTVPFRGEDSWSIVRQVIERDPESLRSHAAGVPRDLELICLKCLAKSPRDRYPTAASLADDLLRFLNREPVSVRPAGVPERAVKWVRRNPSAARLLTLAAAAAVVITSLVLKNRWDASEADKREQLSAARVTVADEQARSAQIKQAAADRAATDREFIRLLTQARNRRLGRRTGWTWAAREDIENAARLPHDDLNAELRDEWVATMTTPDAREVAQYQDHWQMPKEVVDGREIAVHPTKPLVAATTFGYPGAIDFRLTVQLFDAQDGAPLTALKAPIDIFNRSPGGGKESPSGLAFSPDGRWLVMSARSGRLHRWDVSGPTPGPVATWSGRGQGGAIAFSHDSHTLYTRGGNWVQAWDTKTWQETTARNIGADPLSLAPVPDGERLLVSVVDRVLALDPHDLSDLCAPLPVRGYPKVAVGSDGRTGLVNDGDQVAIIDPVALTMTGVLDYRPDAWKGMASPGVSPDGRFVLLTLSNFRGVSLYDFASGRHVCDITVTDRESGPPYAFSPDSRRLYVGGRNCVRVYELNASRAVALRPNPVARFSSSPDGQTLYTVSSRVPRGPEGVELAAWSATAVRPVPRQSHPVPFGLANWKFVAPTRQGTGAWLVSAGGLHLFAWNLANDDFRAFPNRHNSFNDSDVSFGPADQLWIGGDGAAAFTLPNLTPTGAKHADPLVGILHGHGSANLVTGGRSGVLVATGVGGLAWVNEKGQPLSTWAGEGMVSALALSPDEHLALAGLESGSVSLVRLAGDKQLITWSAHEGRVTAACWLGPREFATGSSDRTVTLWQLGTGNPLKLFTFPTSTAVRDLAFVAGGGLAVLETDSRAVVVHNVAGILKGLAERGLGVPLAIAPLPTEMVGPFPERPPVVTGLRADYFSYPKESPNDLTHRMTRVEKEPVFDLGEGEPHPSVPKDGFRVCYRGWLKAPKAGQYTLHIDADDEAKVYLDGKPVGERVYRGRGEIPLTLTAQPHRFRIEYSEEFGLARLRLRWSRPGGFAERPLAPALFLNREDAVRASVPDPDAEPK